MNYEFLEKFFWLSVTGFTVIAGVVLRFYAKTITHEIKEASAKLKDDLGKNELKEINSEIARVKEHIRRNETHIFLLSKLDNNKLPNVINENNIT